MIWHGRHIDVLGLWGEFVDLPQNIEEPLPTFLPKVKCPNPEHDTHKHHFQINGKKPFVHCFAHCGISGTYEHALCVVLGIYDKRGVTDKMIRLAATERRPKESIETSTAREKVGASHREARRTILRHTRAALRGEASAYAGLGTRKSVSDEDEVAKDQRALDGHKFHWMPKQAREYLDRRGIDGPARGKWRLGWDEDAERIVIPAYDERGNFRFLIRQRIDGVSYAKYLYTPGSVKTSLLFGACYIDREQVKSSGRLVLCEGPLDSIRLHQAGIGTAVSILGTGISTKQVRLIDNLSPRRVYLMFDKDESGVANIQRCSERVRKIPLFVCRYPSGRSDPAEMTREEVERSLDRAMPIAQFFRKARSIQLGKVGTVGR